jgi:hypothetical protein
MRILCVACFLATASLTNSASARTWYILPDGSGDCPTIQAGIDSASTGDEVLLAAGTYLERGLMMKSGITLRGESGPSSTVIDGEHVGTTVLQCVNVDETTGIEGVTLAKGGHGAYCENASPRFSNCIFDWNWGWEQGGGAFCSGGTPEFRDCVFTRNTCDGFGYAAGGGLSAASATIVGCRFEGNIAVDGSLGGAGDGGAIAGSNLTVTDCVFAGNWCSGTDAHNPLSFGGALSVGSSYFAACEFSNNRAVGSGEVTGAAAYCWNTVFDDCVFLSNPGGPVISGVNVTLTNSLIAHNAGLALAGTSTIVRCTIAGNGLFGIDITGAGIPDMPPPGQLLVDDSIVAFSTGPGFVGEDITLSCCNVFGNEGGDYVDGATGQEGLNGNICRWPLFCDPVNGNYYLSAGSPCLLANNGCGVQIGAFGQGCGPVSLEEMTWGKIKAQYR